MPPKRQLQPLKPSSPALPPTPQSTIISAHLATPFTAHELTFKLPPPALPPSPPSPSPRKKRRTTAQMPPTEIPPPPTRTRKIIQMKPALVSHEPGSVTAPSKKVARKTAHSLIERRRRGRMNEEFAVLKDLVPACRGVEMHKLAILQAGIEYVRYLEGCVEGLRNGEMRDLPAENAPKPTATAEEAGDSSYDDDEEEGEEVAEENRPEVQRRESFPDLRLPSISPLLYPEETAGAALLLLADDGSGRLSAGTPATVEKRRGMSVSELLG